MTVTVTVTKLGKEESQFETKPYDIKLKLNEDGELVDMKTFGMTPLKGVETPENQKYGSVVRDRGTQGDQTYR